ncbi:TetR/AcrR family transcriptional regulator [Frankia sp. AiPs1]|uniref:TetR/AcrR family transcriptional regulator n=1 Tax=Frankia sp. AiPs1 TaxID=573493 RepID=UPI0020433FC7|nr:TetR/AcrR family transcriptional regulator [Frankia sp. AiPs1]MCM3921195.1 TetR/AcrR family transcriptional regulator [Frankia sp. AiPs1]
MTARPSAAAASADRPVRTDALRNRERLLTAARAAFTDAGADASLYEVAKRAGLGTGTVYRHFPTREALLEAVLLDHFEALRVAAVNLAEVGPPDDALADWLQQFISHLGEYRGLAREVMSVLHDGVSPLSMSCQDMRAAGAVLLSRAQRDGTMRADLDMSTLLKLANAVALTAEETDSGRGVDLLGYLMEGMRRR